MRVLMSGAAGIIGQRAIPLGPGRANTISASELASREQAGHLRASDQVRTLRRS
jgi:hypothetical protein